MREATLTTEELQSLTSKDGLLTNMVISGDTQGIAQLITSVSTILDNQAAQEKLDQDSSKGGDGEPNFEDNEARKARMKVCKDLPYSPSHCNVKALISFSTETVFGFVIYKCHKHMLNKSAKRTWRLSPLHYYSLKRLFSVRIKVVLNSNLEILSSPCEITWRFHIFVQLTLWAM